MVNNSFMTKMVIEFKEIFMEILLFMINKEIQLKKILLLENIENSIIKDYKQYKIKMEKDITRRHAESPVFWQYYGEY